MITDKALEKIVLWFGDKVAEWALHHGADTIWASVPCDRDNTRAVARVFRAATRALTQHLYQHTLEHQRPVLCAQLRAFVFETDVFRDAVAELRDHTHSLPDHVRALLDSAGLPVEEDVLDGAWAALCHVWQAALAAEQKLATSYYSSGPVVLV